MHQATLSTAPPCKHLPFLRDNEAGLGHSDSACLVVPMQQKMRAGKRELAGVFPRAQTAPPSNPQPEADRQRAGKGREARPKSPGYDLFVSFVSGKEAHGSLSLRGRVAGVN